MTDWTKHLATLKAYISQDFDEYDRLREELGPRAIGNEYTAVVAAGFIAAVRERFGSDPKVSDITTLVAETRAISPSIASDLDPRTAERLIMAVTHGENIDDIDPRTVVSHEIALIAAMLRDLDMTEPAIDDFLEKVQAIIDETLG